MPEHPEKDDEKLLDKVTPLKRLRSAIPRPPGKSAAVLRGEEGRKSAIKRGEDRRKAAIKRGEDARKKAREKK